MNAGPPGRRSPTGTGASIGPRHPSRTRQLAGNTEIQSLDPGDFLTNQKEVRRLDVTMQKGVRRSEYLTTLPATRNRMRQLQKQHGEAEALTAGMMLEEYTKEREVLGKVLPPTQKNYAQASLVSNVRTARVAQLLTSGRAAEAMGVEVITQLLQKMSPQQWEEMMKAMSLLHQNALPSNP